MAVRDMGATVLVAGGVIRLAKDGIHMMDTCRRRFKIYFDLKVGEYYRNSALAKKYGVGIRTIERDINFFKRLRIFGTTPCNDGMGGFYVSKIKSR